MSQYRLNAKQEEAVNQKNGPLLIIAGAGTGKTATITQRILKIINEKWAESSEILALTFTEKAANEMLDRVEQDYLMGYEDVWISTFHSFCDRVLRSEGHFIGINTNYTLITTTQAYILFRRNLFKFPLEKLRPLGNPTSSISAILKHFARLQDEDITPDEYLDFVKKNEGKLKLDSIFSDDENNDLYPELVELARTYRQYSDLKQKESKLDFADLISLTLKLFRESPAVLKKYQEKFKYILVDEYQDTNYAQNVLVNLLAMKDSPEKANITVVGDDDQAIYKFRGAAISNIMQFKKKYPSSKKIVLTENYRSKQEILDLAYSVIQNNNPDRLEIAEGINKKLISMFIPENFSKEEKHILSKNIDENLATRSLFDPINKESHSEDDENSSVVAKNFKDYYEESDYVVEQIMKNAGFPNEENKEGKYKYKYADIAILVRSNRDAEEISNSLKYAGIPYKFGGPKGLYQRKEIKPFINFLKLLANRNDNVSAFGLFQMDQFGFSPRDLMELTREAKYNNWSLIEFLENSLDIKIGSFEKESSASKKINKKDGNIIINKDYNFSEKSDFSKRDEIVEKAEKSIPIQKYFSQKAILGMCNMIAILDQAYTMIRKGRAIADVLFLFFRDTGYLGELVKEDQTEAELSRNAFYATNIQKYFETVKLYEKEAKNNYVQDYLDYLNYSIEIGDSPSVEIDELENLDAVRIMTVHGSKGLEFPIVFLPHLVVDKFPTREKSDPLPIPESIIKEKVESYVVAKAHLQEERRLFYVAMTRAKEKLYLTSAKQYEGLKREKKKSIFLIEAEKFLKNPPESVDTAENEEKRKAFSIKEMFLDDLEMSIQGDNDEIVSLLEGVKMNNRQGFKTSYSQLSSYEWCPKKYAFSSVYKIQTPKSASLTFGTTIHSVLRELYERHIQASKSFKGMVDYPDLDFIKEAYERHWDPIGYDSKDHENKRKKRGLKILTDYFNENYSVEEKPLFLELNFTYQIEDVTLRGQIDRVDLIKEENGVTHVKLVDYKTGTLKAEKYQDNLQLSIYVLELEKRGFKVDQASYFYIEEKENVNIDLTKINKDIILKKVLDIANKIKNGDFKATPDIFKCKYCDFKAICDNSVA